MLLGSRIATPLVLGLRSLTHRISVLVLLSVGAGFCGVVVV